VAFTNRRGGVSVPPFDSLNLGNISEAGAHDVVDNLKLVRERLGLLGLAGVRQIHSSRVIELPDGVGVSADLATADGLVTSARGVGLLIRVADCLPVLLADPEAGVIGAAHAGRVGLLDGVLPATIAAMRRLGARHVTAWIGPHICGRCYEVPPDMAQAAWQRLPATRALTARGTPAIDLGQGAAAQLTELGCACHRFDPCTQETSAFFSYRRDGRRSGRQAGIIWQES